MTPSLIMGDEAALVAAGSFCHKDWMMFLQGLITSNKMVQQAVHAQIHATLMHQEDMDWEFIQVAQQPAAAAAAPSVEVTEMKAKAIKDAESKILGTVQSILDAEEACGEPNPDLQNAIQRLQDRTDPLARGAADAQRLVHQVLSDCPSAAEKAIKKADRNVRDIIVLRCRACCVDPKDRDGFLVKATEAFQGDLDKAVRAQLLLAYHKDPTNQKFGFVSNNQVAADRRGGPRPRRRRHKSDGNISTSCPAAWDEPMWLEPPTYITQEPAEWDSDGYCVVPSSSVLADQEEDIGPEGLHPEEDKEFQPTEHLRAGSKPPMAVVRQTPVSNDQAVNPMQYPLVPHLTYDMYRPQTNWADYNRSTAANREPLPDAPRNRGAAQQGAGGSKARSVPKHYHPL